MFRDFETHSPESMGPDAVDTPEVREYIGTFYLDDLRRRFGIEPSGNNDLDLLTTFSVVAWQGLKLNVAPSEETLAIEHELRPLDFTFALYEGDRPFLIPSDQNVHKPEYGYEIEDNRVLASFIKQAHVLAEQAAQSN